MRVIGKGNRERLVRLPESFGQVFGFWLNDKAWWSLYRMFLLLMRGRMITFCLFLFPTMMEFIVSGYDAAAWEIIG